MLAGIAEWAIQGKQQAAAVKTSFLGRSWVASLEWVSPAWPAWPPVRSSMPDVMASSTPATRGQRRPVPRGPCFDRACAQTKGCRSGVAHGVPAGVSPAGTMTRRVFELGRVAPRHSKPMTAAAERRRTRGVGDARTRPRLRLVEARVG